MSNSFLNDDNIKHAIDKLILSRLKTLTTKDKSQDKKESAKTDKTEKSKDDSTDASKKDKRKLFLGDLAGSLGGAVSSVTGGVGDMLGGEGGVGLAVGGAAAGAGMMAKQQREMEHMHALTRVENEMAACQFSADFQDQAIMELSRAVGRANYVDGRIKTIRTTADYSFSHMLTDFYEIIY